MDAVEAEVEKENPDKTVVIGDLVGLGPEPGDIVQRMMDRPWIDVIVGNVDLWVTRKVWETVKPKWETGIRNLRFRQRHIPEVGHRDGLLPC